MHRILYILSFFLLLGTNGNCQQREDIGWIAPEGKIINQRTLTWEDFLGKQDKEFAAYLASYGLQAQAYVVPSIYFVPSEGEVLDNGRVKFSFKAKCAFQSHAFVREDVKKAHSNYVYYHEHDHYDIALAYAQKMEEVLSTRDYSAKNYADEINAIIKDYYTQYFEVQAKYDKEVNPEGRDDVPMQTLWDMRIKKCRENNTLDFMNSPESAVISVKGLGQTVKRAAEEPMRKFATRCRPIYSEFTDETAAMSMETEVWGIQKVVIAFYKQRYYIEEEGKPTKDASRLLGYLFMPNGKDTYKRILIDTFCNDDIAPKINTVFFANADTDNIKELVIQTSVLRKDRQISGIQYTTKIFDNIAYRAMPGKLRRLDDVSAKLENGVDGTVDGKPQKARLKNQKELTDELIKLGFPNEANAAPAAPKRTIHQ